MDIPSYLLGKKAGGGGGSNLQTKSVTVTQNGSSQITPDTGYDGLTKVNLTTNVQPTNQTKSLTITENTTTTISPDTGYDGLSSVEITTNVSGGGDLDWSALGYSDTPQAITDGYNYALEIKNNWDSSITDTRYKFENDNKLQYMPLVDTSNVLYTSYMFSGCSNLCIVPALIFTNHVSNYERMFKDCINLKQIDLSNFDVSNVSSIRNMFSGCKNLIELDMSNFEITRSVNGAQMFDGAINLQKIDMRKIDFSKFSSYTTMFGASATTGVPDNCLIIVKDATQKTWINTNFSRLTNVKTVNEL